MYIHYVQFQVNIISLILLITYPLFSFCNKLPSQAQFKPSLCYYHFYLNITLRDDKRKTINSLFLLFLEKVNPLWL